MSEEIAACGLLCGSCDIRLASDDQKLAESIAEWFKTELNEDVSPKDMHCEGCHGPREKHWSQDCWILHCCVDDKGLENCSHCKTFPCVKLVEWATQNDGYGESLERLMGS